ncbi:MAG: TonB-dependent receptor [Victivallales bacterium]|nr:TonB-dependent receptor [Victivallales bacterium]
MNLKKLCIRTIPATLLCFLSSTFAQEAKENVEELPAITVTGVRTNARADSLGQSITILDRKQFEPSELPYAQDIIREQPGISFYSYGPRASNPVISLRGMHTYHTKLLIDGFPYIDNSQTAGLAPMFDNLSLDLIDRVEIVKGAVSLQGSSALGGIVNIITRKPPKEDGTHGIFNVEAGSHGRFDTTAIVYGRQSIVDYKVGVARQRERGISVYRKGPSAAMSINGDNDHFRSMNYFADLGFQLDDKWRIELGGSFTDTDEEYDDGYTGDWGSGPDDDNIWLRKYMGHAKIAGTGLLNDTLDLSLSYAQTRADRDYIGVGAGNGSRYLGDLSLINAQATLHINDWNTLTAGIDFQHEQVRGFMVGYDNKKYKGWDETYRTVGYYIGYQIEPVENLFFNANFRYNHHSDFDHEWTGNVSARYLLEPTGTTFRTSYGKGYRAPNPYELMPLANNLWYWRGNPDLKPEKARTWDIGIEQDIIGKQLTADITYFQNAVENYIEAYGGYDAQTWMNYPVNVDKMKIRGIEAGINARPIDALSFRFAYTWQHARNIQTGDHFRPLIADHQFSFDATWNPIQQLDLNIGGVFVGPRQNANGAGSANKMHNYCLIHTTIGWKFNDHFKVYGRIDNLLNENYATVDSYGIIYNTYGRVYYIGLTYSF